MPFAKSVAATKIAVASSEYLSKEHSADLELKLFGERWGSQDQKSGFSSVK